MSTADDLELALTELVNATSGEVQPQSNLQALEQIDSLIGAIAPGTVEAVQVQRVKRLHGLVLAQVDSVLKDLTVDMERTRKAKDALRQRAQPSAGQVAGTSCDFRG